jgi:hypothetical protein
MQIDKWKYVNFKDLRVFVIEPSIKEINVFSDIKVVQVDYIKTGRAVSSVIITATPNNQLNLTIDSPSSTLTLKSENSVVQTMIEFGISEISAKRWAEKYDSERVLRSIQYTEYQHQLGLVKSKGGYFSKVIAEDIGLAWGIEQAKLTEAANNAKQQESNKEILLEEQRKKQEAVKGESVTVFEKLNEDEKEFYLDEMQAKLKGKDKAYFQAARAGYTKAGNTQIFTEFSALCRETLQANGLID